MVCPASAPCWMAMLYPPSCTTPHCSSYNFYYFYYLFSDLLMFLLFFFATVSSFFTVILSASTAVSSLFSVVLLWMFSSLFVLVDTSLPNANATASDCVFVELRAVIYLFEGEHFYRRMCYNTLIVKCTTWPQSLTSSSLRPWIVLTQRRGTTIRCSDTIGFKFTTTAKCLEQNGIHASASMRWG